MDRPRRSGRTSATAAAPTPSTPGTPQNGQSSAGALSRSPSTSSLGPYQQQRQPQVPSNASPNAHHWAAAAAAAAAAASSTAQRGPSNDHVPASHYASPNYQAGPSPMASSPFLPPSAAVAASTAAGQQPMMTPTPQSRPLAGPGQVPFQGPGHAHPPQPNGHPVPPNSRPPALGPSVFPAMPPYPENAPMGRNANPLPPQTAVGPGQALYTTFASRMQTGITTLMQPIPSGPDLQDVLAVSRGMSTFGTDYGTTERTRGGGTRRRAAAGMTYYGEEGSDFDDDDDDDDEDGQGSGVDAERSKRQSAAGTPAEERKPQEEEEEEKPGALLGMPPPGNKVFVRRANKVHPIAHSETDLLEQAERAEFLIPIRVELETETHRIKDTFTWNLREHLIKPRDFARSFVRDLSLPVDPYTSLVEAAIIDQIKLYQSSGIDLVHIGPAPGGPWASRANGAKEGGEERGMTLGGAGALSKLQRGRRESRQWDWGLRKVADDVINSSIGKEVGERKRKREATAAEDVVLGSDGDHEDDLRVIVDYDVQIYKHHLRDRLEWDLASPLTPEAFASQLSKDLALTGEALPIVSNAIREQLLMHTRAAQECDLIGKGGEYAKWQAEIDDAEAEEAENRRRKELGLESLPLKPLQTMPEIVEEEQEPLLELAPRRGRPPRRLVEERERLEREREERLQQQREQLLQLQQQQQQAKEQQQQQRQQQLEQQSRQVAASVARDELGGGGGGPSSDSVLADGSEGPSSQPTPLPRPPPTVILRTPAQRKSVAQFYQSQLTERGPRKLEGVWRDYHDSKEFGPLLEMLTEEELERIEQEAIRASRRGRRDQQRNVRVRRR